MKWKKESIDNIKENPGNPRVIKDRKFRALVESIKNFPEMLEIRPIVVNREMIVLGGNQRLKACKEAGFKEVPIVFADTLTPEQEKEFVIKDNVQFGDWDQDELQVNWDKISLGDWGLVIKEKEDFEAGKVEFSEFLGEANNYVILKFDNEIDWLNAQTHFNLDSVYSKRANGKPWSKGIGRVINGAEYLKKLNEK